MTVPPSVSLSDALADHVASCRPESLAKSTLHAAKRALLDGLGVMLAASGLSDEARPFTDLALGAGTGPAPLVGRPERVGFAMAALANGALSHALDFEDAFDAAPSHPNAALLPAAFALLHAGRPVSGTELLSAIAVGCDLSCRLGLSLTKRSEDLGWYPPPMLGAYGATAAAARLLSLDRRRTLDAFSLTLCQATCPGEIKYSRDTVIRAVREAFPAQAAVVSAQLAASGVRGFEQPFEGKAGFFRLFVNGHYDPAVLLDRLGEHFWIDELSFKQWPACRGTHPHIEVAERFARERGLVPDQIVEVIATGSPVQTMLTEPAERKRAPTVAIDAKFSIPFTVAVALVQGRVTLDSFAAGRLDDPAVLAMARKIRFVETDIWGRDAGATGTLAIRLSSGELFEETIDEAIGHPSRPLSDDQLRAKFVDCARQAHRPIAPDVAERMADGIFGLETASNAADVLFPTFESS